MNFRWKTYKRFLQDCPAKASGVYLIRETGILGAVVYVGESHSDRLKQTAQRHFQSWSGPTSGPTYSQSGTLVAFLKTRSGNAVELQNSLIEELRPRDNTQGKPEWALTVIG